MAFWNVRVLPATTPSFHMYPHSAIHTHHSTSHMKLHNFSSWYRVMK